MFQNRNVSGTDLGIGRRWQGWILLKAPWVWDYDDGKAKDNSFLNIYILLNEGFEFGESIGAWDGRKTLKFAFNYKLKGRAKAAA